MFSVLNQSYGDVVVCIYDNASGDETEEAARELVRLDGRVKYYRHQENIGSLNNMIFGMERVTTPYFNILCDDDLLMPAFLETAVGIHEAAERPAAFVSARVVTVDRTGRIQPYRHPAGRLTLAPPDGIVQCLSAGLSLTGALYRASAMASIGPPRTAWWNWTESGWTALAATKYSIEFTPEVGGIVFVHADSGSKQMSMPDFRVSWFEMLAELRQAASQADVSDEWWKRRVEPLAYSRFLGSVTRLCTREGAKRYTRFGALGTACGLNAFAVRGALAVARTASALGIGDVLNGAFDARRERRRVAAPAAGAARLDGRLVAVSKVLMELNRQAGIG